MYTGDNVVQSSLPCVVSLRVHFTILTLTKTSHWIASTFDMYIYIYVDDNITKMQDGPSLETYENWLLIFVLVHVSALCPDPESLVPIEST